MSESLWDDFILEFETQFPRDQWMNKDKNMGVPDPFSPQPPSTLITAAIYFSVLLTGFPFKVSTKENSNQTLSFYKWQNSSGCDLSQGNIPINLVT